MFSIGQIIKAQGISGELKVNPATCDINRFFDLKEVIIKNTSFALTGCRVSGSFVFLKLKGICDRNSAEALIGEYIMINRNKAIKLPKGQYFVVDLLDCRVFLDDEYLGVLKEINQFGTADVYVVLTENNKTVSFPFLKDLIRNIDVNAKEIYLIKKRFFEVAVYN